MDPSQVEAYSLLPIFLLSFLSEILIPIPIGLILIAMIIAGYAPAPVVFVSLMGFTLGAIVAFGTGRYGVNRWDWFKKHEDSKTYTRTKKYYGRYGAWTVLAVWIPAFGKYIPPVAGIMKLSWVKFLPLYIIGKLIYFIPLAIAVLILSKQ